MRHTRPDRPHTAKTPDANPRPGGMREAIESAAPCLRQVHGVFWTLKSFLPPYLPAAPRPRPFRRTLLFEFKMTSKIASIFSSIFGIDV